MWSELLCDPDLQCMIYRFLGVRDLVSVHAVSSKTTVTKDIYLKAIQSYANNKVERFVMMTQPFLKDMKEYDFLANVSRLDDAWHFASKIDNDLYAIILEDVIEWRNNRYRKDPPRSLGSIHDIVRLEQEYQLRIRKTPFKRHFEDLYLLYYVWCLCKSRKHDNLVKWAESTILMVLHSTPELTFKTSCGCDWMEIFRHNNDYKLFMSRLVFKYMALYGLHNIEMRMHRKGICIPGKKRFKKRDLELQDNQFIVIETGDHQSDPLVYATGLEMLIRIREGKY